jgi:deoxyhypusine synthase
MTRQFLQHRLTRKEDIQRKAQILSEPVQPVDLDKAITVAELMDAYDNSSIQARNLGGCAKIFERMLTDEERPTILLGLAGPLIAGGLRKVIRDLIEHNMVDVIVSTGAILYQDYYQAKGYRHYRGTEQADDAVLRDLLVNRIYDTYVDEEVFSLLDMTIASFADGLEPGLYSSRTFLARLSETIDDEQSILVTARKRGIPVFSPALNDSSIGIGLTEHYCRCRHAGKRGVTIDSIRDNYELTQVVVKSKRTSAFYVAGGVPKNYINDSVVMAYIFGMDTGGHKYALQVTTDVPHWGGLSGSTLAEAMSWGKVNRTANKMMAFVEPTVSLPLIAGYALQKRLGSRRSRIAFEWDKDLLKEIRI